MRILRENNLHISITPESEFHYSHCQNTGRSISDQASLGIDTNFTFSGDMITQARMWLQSARHANYQQTLKSGFLPKQTPMSVEQAFLLATRQGARALRRQDIGVLTIGAKADIAIFNGESPSMLGWRDPVAAVILHANASDIEHVIVGGEFRKRDYKLVGKKHDWNTVKQRFLDVCRRVQPLAHQPPPVPHNVFGHGQMADVDIISTIR
jgi:cytosine/adenosine deaminase-related metal-dependent hydrolase